VPGLAPLAVPGVLDRLECCFAAARCIGLWMRGSAAVRLSLTNPAWQALQTSRACCLEPMASTGSLAERRGRGHHWLQAARDPTLADPPHAGEFARLFSRSRRQVPLECRRAAAGLCQVSGVAQKGSQRGGSADGGAGSLWRRRRPPCPRAGLGRRAGRNAADGGPAGCGEGGALLARCGRWSHLPQAVLGRCLQGAWARAQRDAPGDCPAVWPDVLAGWLVEVSKP